MRGASYHQHLLQHDSRRAFIKYKVQQEDCQFLFVHFVSNSIMVQVSISKNTSPHTPPTDKEDSGLDAVGGHFSSVAINLFMDCKLCSMHV